MPSTNTTWGSIDWTMTPQSSICIYRAPTPDGRSEYLYLPDLTALHALWALCLRVEAGIPGWAPKIQWIKTVREMVPGLGLKETTDLLELVVLARRRFTFERKDDAFPFGVQVAVVAHDRKRANSELGVLLGIALPDEAALQEWTLLREEALS